MTATYLDALRSGLSAVERLAAATTIEIDATIDRLTASGRIDEAPEELLAEVIGTPAHGHTAHLSFASAGWSLVVDAQPGSAAVITESGDRADALPDTDIADFAAAVSRNDVAHVVQIAARSLTAEIQLVVVNNAAASGHHWLRSADSLRDLLTGARWVLTARAMASGPPSLVVDDAGSGVLRTQGLNIFGPDAAPSTPPDQSRTATGHIGNRRPDLPSPHLVSRPQVIGDACPELERLVPILHATARRLVWSRLATATEVEANGAVKVTLSGARIVEFSMEPSDDAVHSDDDVDLYDWAFGVDDPGRYDSAVHAATLAILHERDLATAAAPTLRTARSLYALSRSGAVAEALATRRAARDAVQRAAQSAAETARAVSGKAVERCLLQLGAAIAIMLTNAARLIDDAKAYALLVAVAMLAAVSMTVALVVELKSGREALCGDLLDLDQYREALTAEDISTIRDANTVKSSRGDLRRALVWTILLYSATAVVVLGVGAALVFSHGAPGQNNPVPATQSP